MKTSLFWSVQAPTDTSDGRGLPETGGTNGESALLLYRKMRMRVPLLLQNLYSAAADIFFLGFGRMGVLERIHRRLEFKFQMLVPNLSTVNSCVEESKDLMRSLGRSILCEKRQAGHRRTHPPFAPENRCCKGRRPYFVKLAPKQKLVPPAKPRLYRLHQVRRRAVSMRSGSWTVITMLPSSSVKRILTAGAPAG